MTTTATHWYARPAARTWRCEKAPTGEVARFHAGLPGYRATPLVELPALARELAVGRVFVKDESARLGLGAFKALGASWAICRVLAESAKLSLDARPVTLADLRAALASAPPVELVTATDGNHGRAVAWVARQLGVPARVFVPDLVAASTVEAIAGEGADVTVVTGAYDDAVRAAARAADRPASFLVQDTSWAGYTDVPQWIVDGYSTLLREVDEQLAQARAAPAGLVVVPVGVGSLAQAVIAHYRADSSTALLGVEPDRAACVLASLLAGELRSVSTGSTIMAGLNCGTPSMIAWPYLRDGLDAVVAVSDAETGVAMADLRALGVNAGACGAATLAGARAALGQPDRRSAMGVDAHDGGPSRGDASLGDASRSIQSRSIVLLCTEGSSEPHHDPLDHEVAAPKRRRS